MSIKDNNKYFTPEIETASRDYLRAIQSARLIKMVHSCYNNVPFYKKKFDEMGITPEDIKTIDDLSKLPFTDKTDLAANYPFGMIAVPKKKIVRIHASSGTTGKKKVVAYTKDDVDHWAEGVARALAAIGTTRDDAVQVSYGYGLFTGGLGVHYGVEKFGATVIPVSTGDTNGQIKIMQEWGSSILCCTPSYALTIGERVKEMGIDPKSLNLRAGLFGAEAWSENMRVEIEKSLAIKAYDIFGLTEIAGPGVAYDCEEQNGMHICEDYFYPEIVDPETLEPLKDGEYGELVFTTIGKEALPLIRYRTHDIAALTHEKCACGRTVVRLLKLKGRNDDMLIINGVNVFPSQVESVLLSLGMEPYYQLVIDKVGYLDKMQINIEMSEELFSDSVRKIEETERMIAAEMKAALIINPKVTLVGPHTLPRFEGKAKRVIDNRKM